MMVGIGPCFLWLHARSCPGRNCFVPYVIVALTKRMFLNSHRTGHAYSKHHLRVNLDISSFDFAVACQWSFVPREQNFQ